MAYEGMMRVSLMKSSEKAMPFLEQLASVRTEISEILQSKETMPSVSVRLNNLQRKERHALRSLSDFSKASQHFFQAKDVFSSLSQNEVFIDFARVKNFNLKAKSFSDLFPSDNYCAWVYHPRDPKGPAFINLGDATEIDDLIAEYLGILHEADDTENPLKLKKISRKIEQRILEPIRDQCLPLGLHQNLSLVISPDSTLWMLPWAALQLRNGNYLIEDVVLRTVVSARGLCANKIFSKTPSNNSAVVFSDPDFDDGRLDNKQPSIVRQKFSGVGPRRGAFVRQDLPETTGDLPERLFVSLRNCFY